jgi:hypothetical protein
MHITVCDITTSFSTGIRYKIISDFNKIAYSQQKQSDLIVVTYPDALCIAKKRHGFVRDTTLGALTHDALVKLLVNAYPEALTTRNVDDETPISLAILMGLKRTTIVYLAKQGPEALKLSDGIGHYPLHSAIAHGYDADCIRSIAIACPQVLLLKGSNGELPLHASLTSVASDGTIIMLMEQQPEAACYMDDDGSLPLHLALSERRHLEIIKLIVAAYPAALTVPCNQGLQPLEMDQVYTIEPDVIAYLKKTAESLVDVDQQSS